MARLMEVVGQKLRERLNAFLEDMADAIECADSKRVIRNVFCAVSVILAIFGSIALLLALLYAGRKAIAALLGPPLLIGLLIASYFVNAKDKSQLSNNLEAEDSVLLTEQAEAVYEFVRDGVFLVLRRLSEYTDIICPSMPSAIETNVRYYIRNGVAIFQFNTLQSGEVSLEQFQQDFGRVLGQMLRAHELPGLPNTLVRIEGKQYPPIQVLSILDVGGSLNINLVFMDVHSVAMIDAKRRIQLAQKTTGQRELPYDREF